MNLKDDACSRIRHSSWGLEGRAVISAKMQVAAACNGGEVESVV